MTDKLFYLRPEKKKVQPITSADIARQTAEFERSGKKIQRVPMGASGEVRVPEFLSAFSEVARKRAEAVNRKHGGRLTAKQIEVMHAAQKLAETPGAQITKQGLKNILKLNLSTLNERLRMLENKGFVKVHTHTVDLLRRCP